MENTGEQAVEKEAPEEKKEEAKEPDNLISINQFMDVELRVAEILEVEAIPKSKKLVKLQVTLGEALGNRQILAGIAPYFEDLEALKGRKIVVVANSRDNLPMEENLFNFYNNKGQRNIFILQAGTKTYHGWIKIPRT